jgi:tetratricopeptide (TPR) repeat protein
VINKGMRYLSDGRLEEAEKTLKEALRTPLLADMSDDSGSARKRWKWQTELKHARVHLHLARLYLDQGRPDEAEEALKAARDVLDVRQEERFQGWLSRIEARIQIQRGEYETAFKRLNKRMMQKHRSNSTEGYLLLAIAARALGKEDVLADSLEAAEEQGADVTVFAAMKR